MKRSFFAGFILLFSFLQVFAQADIENQVLRGIELANDFQWDKADEIFSEAD